MFKFKLVIYFTCLFYFGNLCAEHDKTPLLLGATIGLSVIALAVVFAEQLEAHLVEIGVSVAMVTLFYLALDRQWYLPLQGLLHQAIDYWIPPEPTARPSRAPITLPPPLHQSAPEYKYSGKRLEDMAKLPYS